MVKRILALDVGERRIGVAVSDLLGITAQGVETIFTEGLERDLKRVGELARRYETDQLLLGLPMRMSGEEGLQAGRVRAFAERLSEMGLQVRFQDERLTSVSAERVLIDAGVSRKGRKQVIDKMAAVCILQAFLDAGGWREMGQSNRETGEREVYRLMDGYMEEDNIVELIDDEGNELRFQHLMTPEWNGNSYVILAPAEEMEDIGEDEAVVLRIDQDDEGNDVYASIEDEGEMESVFNRYLEIAEADEDDEEAEYAEAEDDEDDDK